ncbi:iron-containing alcohol dehydrogenase [Breznakiella homolactica]|uniref:Iron-containing alcohol dehydrogenase n=1 Tax=Breznakiella homolactica TaxID=2798577 RepID=A0A7T8BAD2_9SPIR|nr:iron-containing alcohol dehydrogenase [Breznakiella homolactica]QQO08885.1 iron-containing alcohol dehydrogenase [Breznakiella homolactica]
MNNLFKQAESLLSAWKGESYTFGWDILDRIGPAVSRYGTNALLVCNTTYLKPVADAVSRSLAASGVSLAGNLIVPEAGPNAPREDVYRIESYILHHKPDCIIAVGGGSAIDACKAANILACLGRDCDADIEAYFGTGLVSDALRKTGNTLLPLIAVQTSASSGSHLTKYSNVTDMVTGQKKLIVDDAIIPAAALFDYAVTASMPAAVTIDGALDAIAHCFEVFAGADETKFDLAASIADCAVALTVEYAPRILKNPNDAEARTAIGMATDLGGYAIMVGGTNGAHLTSFSLVNLTSHGKACGIMNPYYAVFFSPAIEKQLRRIGGIFSDAGYITEDLKGLSGKALGIAVARGMINFGKAIGAPVTLGELPGFSEDYIVKALDAAKNPQLEMKLKNMPVPLTPSLVDEYMAPILCAAVSGDFSVIRIMQDM